VVANHAQEALGTDENRVTFVTAGGADARPSASKHAVADAILDFVRKVS
jgi:hypothetical protein